MRQQLITLFKPAGLLPCSLTGLKLSVVLLLTLGLAGLQAQESVNATGGLATGSEGLVSYTVGQTLYQTHTGAAGELAEGVQQPYEVFIVGLEDLVEGISLTAAAFPNPVSDLLKLKVEKEMHEKKLAFQLINLSGKQLESRRLTSETTEINMGGLPSGVYFLKLIDADEKEHQTFKIIKR